MTRWGHSTCIVAIGLMAAAPIYAQKRQAQGMSHVPAEQLALACAPTLAFEAPTPSLIITGGQDSFIHHAYGPGELITINAGTDNGIEVGQEYFVRRLQAGRTGISRTNPATVKTAAWVKVYAVDPKMSLVTVTHACDVVIVGDFLEPFALPTMPVADANPPKPQRENYGHVMLGTDRHMTFAKGDFFVIDRGSDHGVTVGERVIIFRDKKLFERAYHSVSSAIPTDIVPEFLFELGEAVVVDVKPETSTVKAIDGRDAFLTGDYVALRK